MTLSAPRIWPLILCAAAVSTLCLVLPDSASAQLETRLCGMRLGDHANRLMDVHGLPDGIAVETGGGEVAPEVGFPAGLGGPAVSGAPAFPSPLGGRPGVRAPRSIGGGGGDDDDDEEEEEEEDEDDEDGGGPSVGGRGGAAAAGAGAFPTWALPLWVPLRPGETMWVYNGSKNPKYKAPVVMGFVLDRDGFINVISIAGKYCSWAATANNDPEKRIVLRDNFGRILQRYHWPDDFVTFSATGATVAQPFTGEIAVSFAEGSNLFARDLVLRYTERSNVAFTLHDFTVTRIHIWTRE